MTHDFDAIVVGSGFGGSVTACRLAEKGLKVVVLERGRRWTVEEYPSVSNKNWIYDNERPQKLNGWMDLRFFGDMTVAAGAGVGGGSLIYANVSVEAKPFVFENGWPKEITYSELKPHYDRVGQMLNVQKIPSNQYPKRYFVMKDGAEKIGHGDRHMPVDLAVTFNQSWTYEQDDPFNQNKSVTWKNPFEQTQGTCVHCGNCDIGCPVEAKNTLEKNYLPLAEKNGAEIRPLHKVSHVEKLNDGYRVHFDQLQGGHKVRGSLTAKRVFLSAGSLGSTEILLRSKHVQKTLPKISNRLGDGWCANGDFITPSYHSDRDISSSQGPTITSAIDFLDGVDFNERVFIEDGGFPDVLGNFLETKMNRSFWRKMKRYGLFGAGMAEVVRNRDPMNNVMLWFGQAVDASDGHMYMGRPWYAPWRRQMKMKWDYRGSEAVTNVSAKLHTMLAEATGGKPLVPPTWTLLKNLITPHPLGGCNMATDVVAGVVDHKGEVFNYPDLYVVDGAIIPRAIGLNPSRTIAALAERTAKFIE